MIAGRNFGITYVVMPFAGGVSGWRAGGSVFCMKALGTIAGLVGGTCTGRTGWDFCCCWANIVTHLGCSNAHGDESSSATGHGARTGWLPQLFQTHSRTARLVEDFGCGLRGRFAWGWVDDWLRWTLFCMGRFDVEFVTLVVLRIREPGAESANSGCRWMGARLCWEFSVAAAGFAVAQWPQPRRFWGDTVLVFGWVFCGGFCGYLATGQLRREPMTEDCERVRKAA